MPLDTSIALQAKAPEFNPLQQALQVAQYRAYNANGQAAQQGLDANRAISAAYQQATDPTTGRVDNNKLMALIGGNPAAAFKLGDVVQSINTQKQQQQTLDRGDIALNNEQRGNFADSMKFLTQQFATVDPKDPGAQGKFLRIAGDAIEQGHVPPSMVKATIAQMPDDPSQFGPWFQQKLASFQDVGAQLKSTTPTPTQIDNGGSIQYKDTNPITNPGIIGTNINKTLDPTTASSPVSVMGPNNTPGVVPRGEMWGGVSGVGTPQINIPPLPTAGNPQGAGQAAPMPGQAAPAPAAPAGGPAHFVATGTPMGAAGVAADAGTRYGALQQAAQQAKPLMQTYDLAAQALKSTIAGKGANAALNVPALLNTFGIQAGTDAVKNNQLLANYLNSAADQAAASLGLSGSDSRLAAAKAGQPDPNNMNGPALLESINHVKGLQQAVLDRQQATTNFLAQNGNSTAALPQFEAKWNQSFNPDVSYIRSLGSPEDQQAAMQKLKSSGHLQQWTKDYQAMKALGAF
jgi:hypothetical protein